MFYIKKMILTHRMARELVEPDYDELYRYAGFSKHALADFNDNQIKELADQAVGAISKCMNCRAVYTEFPLEFLPEETICFAGKQLQSHHLMLNLHDCHAVYLFAATLGPAVDKLIQKESRINPAKAVMMQAAGAMFIEKYVDLLQNFLASQQEEAGCLLRPRYSPGFGDVPLAVQKTFFELLECHKNLALTLNDSLIMSPEKSVTAFIGIYKKDN